MKPNVIELKEYEPYPLPQSEFNEDWGKSLWTDFDNQLEVHEPSFRNNYQWILTPKGWIGYIPVADELGLLLNPKVEISNLFRMWEYAYRLKSFKFLPDNFECKSLEDVYESLARVLAGKIIDRARKGFYRAYIPEEEQLPYVRGRLDIQRNSMRPWEVRPHCCYEEHTADIEENQILAWTLWRITKSGFARPQVAATVRTAYRSMIGCTSLVPHTSKACIKRFYNRLNEDYRPLHILSRFFLEQSGPSHRIGEKTMLPFLVDMARLYELFVAEWLKENLPDNLGIKAQEKVDITKDGSLYFNVDIVLYDNNTGNVRCVIDTKYKTPDRPSSNDIAQIIAYAETKGTNEGILVYPNKLPHPIDEISGKSNIRIRSLTFSLDGDLGESGQKFMKDMIEQPNTELKA